MYSTNATLGKESFKKLQNGLPSIKNKFAGNKSKLVLPSPYREPREKER
jgi:hypothetical protein